MGKSEDIRDVRATARKALDQGAVVKRRSTVHWDVAGDCLNPVFITRTGRPARKPRGAPEWKNSTEFATTDPRFWQTCLRAETHQVVRDLHNNPLWLDVEAPCRKCDNCRRRRAAIWRNRALTEIRCASRTWFGTLTLSPEAHYLMQCRASVRLKKSAVIWETLQPVDQTAEEHKEISAEITLYVKRIREQSGAKLRIMCVMERHKSGLPHYHLLIHEGAVPVVKSVLKAQWVLGFSKFTLVNSEPDKQAKAAWYVSKYLTKTNEARVRASVSYGDPLKGVAESVKKI